MTAADPLADALAAHRAGRPEVAIPVYLELLARHPDTPDLRHLLALALHGTDPAAAAAELRRTLALAPSTGLYLHNAARLAGGDEVSHARLLARALALDPAPAEAQHRLGALMARSGRHRQAASRFRRALALDPGFPAALLDRATLAAIDRPETAIAGYQRLLAVAEHEGGLGAYGDLLARLGRPTNAARLFVRLIRVAPGRGEAHGALGVALSATGDDAGALASLRRALALLPGSTETWHAFATVLAQAAESREAAIVAAGRALRISPGASDPHLTLALAFFHQGRIRDAIRARRAVIALNPGDAQIHWDFLSFLHLDPELTPEAQLAYRRRVHRRFSDPLTRLAAPHANAPDPGRRLKVGYVDNRMLYRSTHSTNLLPTIEAHDPKQIELYFYTNLPTAMADDMTQRYRAASAGFHHTEGLSDRDVVRLVREDGIDILVDVTAHLTGARTGVFAMKPAPIQVTMMQVGSSGLGAMDYAVADEILLPSAKPSFFTETLIRLPVGFLFEPVADLTPAVVTVRPDRPPTFGSFNQLSKIDEPVLALWARVLERVAGSRLILKAAGLASPAVRRRIGDFFAARGIAPQRLDLRVWTGGYPAHLATFAEIDVVLDCFPYPGMTTSLEALLMGVPVVTLAGDRFVARIGEAILTAVGHPEWIAADAEDYVAIAASLAGDPERLAGLRGRLRDELLASPLGNPRRFTQGLDAAFRDAWRRWCREHPGQSPPGAAQVAESRSAHPY